MVYVVQKWKSYLNSKTFFIKTNQKSLKFLLEQRLNTPFQQMQMAKLIRFEFMIQYKDGKYDIATYFLSRKAHAKLQALLFSSVAHEFYEAIKI